MFKSVGLVARYDQEPALKLATELATFLKRKGLQVYVEDSLKGKISKKEQFVPLSEMKTDFIITIGGDGTILRTSMGLPKPEPPILAVNMGVRGFLTEVEPQSACEAVDRVLNGQYNIEKSVKVASKAGSEVFPDALNDVVVFAGEPSKVLYAQIFKDDKPILKVQADGVIVATQTGCTGYSLSAGGPVLDKEIDAFVLTPICSLTVFRSLIIPCNSKIVFKVLRPKVMQVIIDGKYRKFVGDGVGDPPTLELTKSKGTASFFRFEADFYERLRNRLLFKGTE